MAQLRYHPTPMQLTRSMSDHQMAFPIIEITGDVAQAIESDLATKFLPLHSVRSPMGEDVFITRWMGQGPDPMIFTKQSNTTILCNRLHLFLNAERAFRAGATKIQFLYKPFLTDKRIAFNISKTHTSAVAAYVRFNPFPNWRRYVDWSSPTADISIYATTAPDRSSVANFRKFVIRCPTEPSHTRCTAEQSHDRNTTDGNPVEEAEATEQGRHTEGSNPLPSSSGPHPARNTRGGERETAVGTESTNGHTAEEAASAVGCTRSKNSWVSLPLKRHQPRSLRPVQQKPYHRAPKTSRWPVERLCKIQPNANGH